MVQMLPRQIKLKKIVDKLRGSDSASVFRGMLTLAMGAGAARIVGFASIPILARIYSPEDYGTLALFTSLVAIIVPVATLRYSSALPLPKRDGIAINVLALGLILILVLAIVISTALFLFADTIFAWFNAEGLAEWWWLIILTVVGAGLYELCSLWATRKRKYKIIAKTQLTQSLIGNIAKIALGLLSLKPFGLIFGQFLAQSSGIGSLVKGSFEDFRLNAAAISLARIKLVANYYRGFAFYRLPSQLLVVVSVQAPILIMTTLYSKELTGQLSLAIMAISMPAGIIGSTMSQAFYAEIANLGRNNISKVRKITIDVQKKLFIVGMPCTLLLYLLSEPMFVSVFGSEWAAAGSFAAILSPFILLQLTSAPLIQVLNITGSQIVFLTINILRCIGLFLIFMFFKKYSYDSETLVKTLSAFLSLFYLGVSLFILSTVNKRAEG